MKWNGIEKVDDQEQDVGCSDKLSLVVADILTNTVSVPRRLPSGTDGELAWFNLHVWRSQRTVRLMAPLALEI